MKDTIRGHELRAVILRKHTRGGDDGTYSHMEARHLDQYPPELGGRARRCAPEQRHDSSGTLAGEGAPGVRSQRADEPLLQELEPDDPDGLLEEVALLLGCFRPGLHPDGAE